MKTLEEFLNEQVSPLYETWTFFKQVMDKNRVLAEMEIAVEKYAAHVWQQAIAAQKVICAEHANMHIINPKGVFMFAEKDSFKSSIGTKIVLDKDSIINAPDAVNPFKKTGYEDIIFPGKSNLC